MPQKTGLVLCWHRSTQAVLLVFFDGGREDLVSPQEHAQCHEPHPQQHAQEGGVQEARHTLDGVAKVPAKHIDQGGEE